MTTQYLDEADQLADRIAVIDRGRVIAEGTADELKASVGQSSLHLRLADPEDGARAQAIVARVLRSEATFSPEGKRLVMPVSDPSRIADLLIALKENDVDIVEFSMQKPTLDEVFLALTGHEATPSSEVEDSKGVEQP